MSRAVLAVAAVAALAGGIAPVAAQGVIIQQIIVKVNGEIFTLIDLEQRQIEALRDKNRQVEKPSDLNDATLRTLLAEVTPDILVKAVDDLLLIQRGKELGFRLTDERFKAVLESVKKDNKLDDAGLKAALAQQGISLDQYRQMMERQMIISSVQQQDIMQKVALTDEEARQYYQAHPAEFMKPPTVVLREIFLAVPAEGRGGQAMFTAGVAEVAKQKSTAAYERLKKGEDFATVAAEVSESPTKERGGLLGEINVEQMDPAIKAIIDQLKPGDVSEPIRTARGYQLFKLDSRTAATPEPFDGVRDKIANNVFNERLDAETKKYLAKLRAQALIEWKHDELRKLYDKRLAEMKHP